MRADRLRQAIDAGEVLRVRYHGGARPGAERPLRPLALIDGKLQAFCLQSGETRLFALDRLEVVADDSSGADFIGMLDRRSVRRK